MDGVNLFAWPAYQPGDELVDTIKDTVDQISFYGNKILKADKENDTTWYNAYKELANAIKDFLIEERLISVA
jgi:hypothetical protein